MESPHSVTIFIPSGAGAPGFAGILRCLRQASDWRILSGDTNEKAYGKILSDGFFQMPSSFDESDYISRLKEICAQESVDVILPITTRELGVLSKHKLALELQGVRVIVSDSEAIGLANDKGATAKLAFDLGLPVPKFRIAHSRDSFILAVEALRLETAESLELGTAEPGTSEPCTAELEIMESGSQVLCFKPTMGNGSRGFGVIATQVEAGSFLTSKAGIMPLTVEEWQKRLDLDFEVPLIVSCFMPGVEYSVDMLCSKGKTLFCVPRTRDKMIGGISVAGCVERNLGLIAFCVQLAQAIGLDGPVGMQWREDVSGVPHLLEINPRLQGTTSALALAGINMPLLAVKLALGHELPTTVADILWGSRFVRFWDERVIQ